MLRQGPPFAALTRCRVDRAVDGACQTGIVSTFEGVHEPLVARDVLLGRTTHVRRIVPNKTRRMIGAWCFLDHYGPDDIKATGGMWVPPHPHTGLQTVTWLFEGLGLHTDSLGSRQLIRPGQLNVMTAGHGICHAEVSPEEAPTRLHGVQLWVCLPDERPRQCACRTSRTSPSSRRTTKRVRAVRVMVGSLGGETSPAPTYTPLVGAEITLEPGASTTLDLEPSFEHGAARRAGRGPPGRWSGRGRGDRAQRDELRRRRPPRH